jgi:hypothetical protein
MQKWVIGAGAIALGLVSWGFVSPKSDGRTPVGVSPILELGPVINAQLNEYVEPVRWVAELESPDGSLRDASPESIRKAADGWLSLRDSGKLVEIPSVGVEDGAADYPKNEILAARQDLLYACLRLGNQHQSVEDYERAFRLAEVFKYTDILSYSASLNAQSEVLTRAVQRGMPVAAVAGRADLEVQWKSEREFIARHLRLDSRLTGKNRDAGPGIEQMVRNLPAESAALRQMIAVLDSPETNASVRFVLRSALERRMRLWDLARGKKENPGVTGVLALHTGRQPSGY